MKVFTQLTSKTVPLPRNDVDTDQIIPARFLTRVSRDGFADALFRNLRDAEPQFVLNQKRYQSAKILLAGENFGCGSSREHAVWALKDAGFEVVIAKSFADIFSANSAKNGLLLITLPADVVDSLLSQAEKEDLCLSIDLEKQEVRQEGVGAHHFEYDAFRKHCLQHGLDDMDYLLSALPEIKAFDHAQKTKRFFSTSELSGVSK